MAAPKNPKGFKSDKEWRDVIRRAVHDYRKDPSGKKTKALLMLAHRLVDAALAGDMTAMKEIGDRLDGRPTQGVAGDPEGPAIEVIKRIIVDPDTQN